MATSIAAGTVSMSTYQDAMDCLLTLLNRRIRADASNKGDSFDAMFDYLKMLDLEEPVKQLKVIHVAGTKGKGSTCSFAESILRSCGFRTGLFTSPHLIDIRERFKLDGVEISKEKFLGYFWWCWNRLQEKTDDDIPMPNYYRFLTLLAFKIFSAEQVDVTILEVGLGGKFDPTNVVQEPIVCGISSLGYDHMEILGNTLQQIAGEKAGIFKKGVPTITAPQLDEAMHVLVDKASELDIPLTVAQPLNLLSMKGQRLGLDGEHQYLNAGLAVVLCHVWLERSQHAHKVIAYSSHVLPDEFIKGLVLTSLQGRAQIVKDPQSYGNEITFYLDGAHSPESMDVCANWFSHAIKDGARSSKSIKQQNIPGDYNLKQILMFNCMSVRDPQLLLPHLVKTCSSHGIYFHSAIFVPNQSIFNKLDSHSIPTDPSEVDLSWQQTLKNLWEKLIPHKEHSDDNDNVDLSVAGRKDRDLHVDDSMSQASSKVFPSVPLAIKWIRDVAERNKSVHFQVLVTGSLLLVGDVLQFLEPRQFCG